jgi:hypothetical protein
MRIFLILVIIISTTYCKKKVVEDINECDTIGNFYEDKDHYIRREYVSDEGVIDLKKMLQKYKGRETICNPLNE